MKEKGFLGDDEINEEDDLNEDSPRLKNVREESLASGNGRKARSKRSDESNSNQAGKTDASLEHEDDDMPPVPVKIQDKNRLQMPQIRDDARHYSADLAPN